MTQFPATSSKENLFFEAIKYLKLKSLAEATRTKLTSRNGYRNCSDKKIMGSNAGRTKNIERWAIFCYAETGANPTT
jgi:hypothetical protein